MFSNFSIDRLQRILASPYVEFLGLIASICGILAFLLACYSFFWPRKIERDQESHGPTPRSVRPIQTVKKDKSAKNERNKRAILHSNKNNNKIKTSKDNIIVRLIIMGIAVLCISAPTLEAWKKISSPLVLIPSFVSLIFVIYASKLVASLISRWSIIGLLKYYLSFFIGFLSVAVPATFLLIVLQLALGFTDLY